MRTRLAQALKSKKTPNEDILAALDAAHVAYGKVVPDPAPSKEDGSAHTERELAAHTKKFTAAEKKWRKAVERSYLKALTLKRLSRAKEPVNERLEVNLKAARALGDTYPKISRRIMDAFDKRLFPVKDYTIDARLYEAGFETLAKLNWRGSVAWLRDEVLIADRRPDRKNRTVAALNAMNRFPPQRAKVRNETVKRLIRMFEFVERQADFGGFGDTQGRTGRKHINRAWIPYWKELKPLVIATLRHFATDPVTNEAPVDYKRKKKLVHVADYARWYGRNKRVGYSPWIDPPRKKKK
ncbi:MAG: hypothetical protein O7C98_14715 [Planctomycetota bacterium]|nr:hypothetical protein [Planctomycetota bacterium]